jgi:tetratricopeptide (TPR) repeat protein
MVLRFAHDLLSEGDAYRAISEYQAFLFLFPRHPKATEAYYFLGKAYKAESQWEEALTAFRKVAHGSRKEVPWAQEAALEIGETLLLAGHPAASARAFEDITQFPHWREIHGKALYSATWSWMRAGQWEEAVRALGEIRPDDPHHIASKGLSQEILQGVSSLPQRNPWIAGGLAAVLPGSGHLYVGRPREALTSLILNGAFIAGAIWAFKEGYPVTGGIISFFELSWYFGGISSAAEGAREYNRHQEEVWLQELGAGWGFTRGVDSARQIGVIHFSWRF